MSRLQRLILRQGSGCLDILRQACRNAFTHVAGWKTARSLPGAVSVRTVPARRLTAPDCAGPLQVICRMKEQAKACG